MVREDSLRISGKRTAIVNQVDDLGVSKCRARRVVGTGHSCTNAEEYRLRSLSTLEWLVDQVAGPRWDTDGVEQSHVRRPDATFAMAVVAAELNVRPFSSCD